ncbi:MAG: SPFH domain-containing protein, partial [Neisseriaceae bacterium]
YYIYDGYFGLIVDNGKLQEVVKGPKLGITLPAPFSNVIVVDGHTTNIKYLTVDGLNDINYRDLTRDNIEINAVAEFSYQILDPKKLYYKVDVEKNNIENIVRSTLSSDFHNYIINESYIILHNSNLTIISNQIKDNVNKKLASFGLSVTKFNINKLNSVREGVDNQAISITESSVYISTIATKLVEEANSYKLDQLAKTRANVNKYKILLEQYKKTPQRVVEQMYYDALREIESKPSNQEYKLLFMPLSELTKLANTRESVIKADDTEVRNSNRGVIRERIPGRDL